MPPRSHSSSSHSSHSSSSRSSSSRSYGSSSRSYSSSGSRSSSSRPSSHSSTSKSSRPAYSGGASSGRSPGRPSAPPAPRRPRVNQPTGFLIVGSRRPSYYYGRRHDYVYYPEPWVDSSTGVSYDKGYYDENGQRYDSVSFAKNGKYENVLCHCPYCGQETLLNLDASAVAAQSLQCPHCGGPMEIRSELDDLGGFAQDASVQTRADAKPRKRRRGWILAGVLLLLLALGRCGAQAAETDSYRPPDSSYQQLVPDDAVTDLSLFGDTLYLTQVGQNAYVLSTDTQTGDRVLRWDAADESYYDEVADCWLWYNTELEPMVWQYWYEGVSSDFGDYGWMEHDEDGWFIEASYGNWIPLPDTYDENALWYIED